jgi:hypothetical protein
MMYFNVFVMQRQIVGRLPVAEGLHPFLASVLDRGDWSASGPVHLTPVKLPVLIP